MILSEALDMINHRKCPSDYEKMKNPIKQMDAEIIAIKCIEAQMRLTDMLNDFTSAPETDQQYSEQLVLEFLNEIRYDYKENEDE